MVHLTDETAQASVSQATPSGNSPRASLGLDLAAAGNPAGAEKFLGWVQDELVMMLTAKMPDPVQTRLRAVFTEVMCAGEFIRCYCHGDPASTDRR